MSSLTCEGKMGGFDRSLLLGFSNLGILVRFVCLIILAFIEEHLRSDLYKLCI